MHTTASSSERHTTMKMVTILFVALSPAKSGAFGASWFLSLRSAISKSKFRDSRFRFSNHATGIDAGEDRVGPTAVSQRADQCLHS